MIGSMVKAGFIDWYVLVIMPRKAALGQMRATAGIIVATLLVTALVGICGAIYAARRLAQRFETIAAHARSISEGETDYEWPSFTVSEFDELSADLKLMAESIYEREAYNRVLFSDSPVPLVVIDSETKQCIDGNQAALWIFELAGREDLVGKTLQYFSSEHQNEGVDSRTGFAIHFSTCLAKGVTAFEWTFKTPSDRLWYGDVSMSLFKYGPKSYVQLSIQDITQRKEAQQERKNLEAQFQHAQKLESVGRLAGGVAHDLNNLLSPIIGYGELLQHDLEASDRRKQSVDEIVRAGLRARDIVRQLLAFSRKQTMEFKPIDLNDVLSRFQSLLRRTIREDIDIAINPAASLPLVKGDVGQLEQVIMNLAVNAQDAMPDGGMLTLALSVEELDTNYAGVHEDVMPGNYVLLSVSDTGLGMDADMQKNIFEPFFTTKDKDKGTGLGLATVYGIIKQHGGNVWLYSEPEQGTVFKLYLPVSDATELPEQLPFINIKNLSGKETILLVEDNDWVRDMTLNVLEQYGYEVLHAENGKDALRIMDLNQKPIHLLLTDVIMPVMNGKELYQKVSALHPDIKALYMSGYTEDVIAHHGVMDAGVNFIQKPFSIETLAIKIREVLEQQPTSVKTV